MNETPRNDSARWGALAAVAAVATYALIVFGGIVRITGSGMGCGDDWPLCNGRLIPAMEFETLIEYGHRLAAAMVGVLVLALAALSWRWGRSAAWRPLRRVGLLAAALLIAQVFLGAVTVRLELPPATVVVHFTVAMALLVVLTIGACAGLAGRSRPVPLTDGPAQAVGVVAAYALGVALLGALVANLEAGPACLGFPACNGSWLPGGSGLVHVHWTHRVAAYGLLPALVALPILARRWRKGDRAAFVAALLGLAVGIVQVALAAFMVLALFPESLRAAHLAAGVALVGILVAATWLVARPTSGVQAAP